MIAACRVAAVDCDRLTGDKRRVGGHQKGRHAAISSGLPRRPSGCSSVIDCSGAAMPSKPITLSNIGVSMNPGQMAFARIPLGP